MGQKHRLPHKSMHNPTFEAKLPTISPHPPTTTTPNTNPPPTSRTRRKDLRRTHQHLQRAVASRVAGRNLRRVECQRRRSISCTTASWKTFTLLAPAVKVKKSHFTSQ